MSGRNDTQKRCCLEGFNMNQDDEFIAIDGLPESVAVQVQKPDRYGGVPGLDQDELAEPDELERQVYLQALEPLLMIPVQPRFHSIQPAYDEEGHVDWGPFGTLDFQRLVPKLDKVRYKIDKLKEELADVVLLIDIIKERIPGRTKFLVLKYLKMGIIDLDHIRDYQLWRLAGWYMKAWRLRAEIRSLREKGYGQRQVH